VDDPQPAPELGTKLTVAMEFQWECGEKPCQKSNVRFYIGLSNQVWATDRYKIDGYDNITRDHF
jgi:hypothetical protein